MIAAILRRELRQLWRNRSQGVLPLLFFVLASVCFGLGVPPNSPLLGQFAPAIVWVCSALAILLGGDRAYRDDFRDGVFEQYLVAGVPLSWAATSLSPPPTREDQQLLASLPPAAQHALGTCTLSPTPKPPRTPQRIVSTLR